MAFPRRRPTPALLASIALHLVLGVALVRLLMIPIPLRSFFAHEKPVMERVGFIAMPNRGVTDPGRNGGDGRPLSKTARPPRALVAPTGVPSAIPATPTAPADAEPAGGSGEVIGTGGPTQGVRPSYSDPRVWVPVGPLATLPRTTGERLDSALTRGVGRLNDSIAIANGQGPGKLARGDWTVGRDGNKWGMDQRFIRLGKLSIPTAALALLPLNIDPQRQTGNPTALERQRALARIHDDIAFQSQRMLNEEELREAAKRIRERKDRERRERQAEGREGSR